MIFDLLAPPQGPKEKFRKFKVPNNDPFMSTDGGIEAIAISPWLFKKSVGILRHDITCHMMCIICKQNRMIR